MWLTTTGAEDQRARVIAVRQQQSFTIERFDVAVERPPVASTCFNALKLPPYTTEQALAEKLQLIFEAAGFHEGAVAV